MSGLIAATSASRCKISLLVSDLSESGAGRWGGAIRPFLLAETLKRLGYQVEVLGLAYGQPATIRIPDLPVFAFPCEYSSGALRAMRQILRQISGDIVYAVKLKPSSFGVGLLAKLRRRCPLILDIDDWELSWHGGDEWRYRGGLRQIWRDFTKPNGALRHPDHPLYLRWIEGWYRRADAVTLHNSFLQARYGGTYLPSGKDTTLFDPECYDPEASRAKYGLSGYRVLMFPGAPRPYKGVEDVLMALDRLDNSDFRLAIVGGSPYDDYDQYLQERWGRWIVYLPKCPVQAMPEVVAAAHVLVVPQRDTLATRAQFPLKLTDGMAMAKPILATRVGDIPNILGDTGYLVEPDRPEAIARALEEIFADWLAAQQRGQAARQRCVQYYSVSAMAAILSDVLTQVRL